MRPRKVAAGTHATGCCCLNILVNATDTWTIHVSQLVSSFTRSAGSGGDIVLPSEHAPLDWGSYTARGAPAFQGLVPTAGHELCGHAALMQIGAHPSGANRLSSDVHDPTVRIENAISSEQGVAASQLRGLAGSGPHRGESVDRLTVTGFGGGLSDAALLPADEQARLRFAAHYSRQNGTFIDVIGHSDRNEAAAANTSPDVSDKRAFSVRQVLRTDGAPDLLKPLGMTTASFGPLGLEQAPDGAQPYRHDAVLGEVTIPWGRLQYLNSLAPAGGIDANVDEMARYALLQLDDGTLSGRRVLSSEMTAEFCIVRRSPWGRTGRRPLACKTCTMRLAGSPLTFAA